LENLGWIKLHRKLLDDPVLRNAGLLQIFLYCLLKANHKENEFIHGDKLVSLKRGQFITGRKVLAAKLNQPEKTLYDRLKTLAKLNYISIQSNNKFSVLTVNKYDSYLLEADDDRHQTDNRPTTGRHQTDTNKNDKNNKNEKKTQGDIFENNLLNNFSGNFYNAWKAWNNYRNEIRKPLSSITKKTQLKFLQNYPEAEAV
jgi:hypothetical protein